MDKRKELKAKYKDYKPDMGVYIFECIPSNKKYIGYTNDTKGTINSKLFQLQSGLLRNKQLQKDWNDYGEDNFSVKVLEYLKYDEDESKTDYSDELEILCEIWKDKLDNVEVL